MYDIRFQPIHEHDQVVFIRNERGKEPRLLSGTVDAVKMRSIIVQSKNGIYQLTYHKRSFNEDHLINTVVILPRTEVTGDILDCTEHPICSGDVVAFIETPSQGFSTSLVVGEVINLSPHEIKILVSSDVKQKYMRKPKDVVVIQQQPHNN